VKLLARLQHMIVRAGLAPRRAPSLRWILRFAAAIMASLALWALVLWGLALLVGFTGLR
jgi:hypothetical protein